MSDAARRRGFAVAAAALTIVVVVLLLSPADKRRSSAAEPDRPGAQAQVTTAPATTSTAPAAAPVVDAAGLLAARQAARDFLDSYLRLTHGRGSVGDLRSVAPALRTELRRDPPRVTPARQGRTTTVLGLTAVAQSSASVRAQATLRDASSPSYTLLLYLELRGQRWMAARIGDA